MTDQIKLHTIILIEDIMVMEHLIGQVLCLFTMLLIIFIHISAVIYNCMKRINDSKNFLCVKRNSCDKVRDSYM